MNKKLITACICLATLSSTASAAQVGSYIGVNGTLSNLTNNKVPSQGLSLFKHKNMPGLELVYGYNLNKNIGIETSIGYLEGDKSTTKNQKDQYVVTSRTDNTTLSAYTIKIDAVGYIPLSKSFELYGKFGPAYGRVKAENNETDTGYGLISPVSYINHDHESHTDNKLGYNVGAGAILHLTKKISVKAGYEYTQLGDYKFSQADLGMFYHF